MIGLYGAGFSAVQVAVTERSVLAAAPWNWQVRSEAGNWAWNSSLLHAALAYSRIGTVRRRPGRCLISVALLSADAVPFGRLCGRTSDLLFSGAFFWTQASTAELYPAGWQQRQARDMSASAGLALPCPLQVPWVLQFGGAAVLNLSLLSSDLWAAAARVLFFGGT